MVNLDDCVGVLRRAGLTVHEVEGWIHRGYAGQDMASHRGILWHHTATHRSRFTNDPAPTVGMCAYGRADPPLPGPLCNIVFDRNGHVWMIATGVGNHAGKGSAPGIPTNTGNHHLIGIEMESSGIAPWDWTAAQLHWAPILGAALESHYLDWLPDEQKLQLGHMEYSSEGKIDPAGWPGGMDGLRASINAVLRGEAPGANEGDDMSAADVEAINKVTVAQKGLILDQIWGTAAVTQKQNAENAAQIKGLVGAVAAMAKGEEFDEAKLLAGVQAAAAAGVKEAIDSIETTAKTTVHLQ